MLRGDTVAYRIRLTDKFPNFTAFEKVKAASANRIDFDRSSVDAMEVPAELEVLRIIPVVLLFDGLVSCLRTYRTRELRELIEELAATDYWWEVGEHSGTFRGLPVTYLIGYPREHRGAPLCRR